MRALVFTISICVLCASCTFTLPNVDQEPPAIRFKITGENVSEVYNSEDDYEEPLELWNNETYRFEMSASDKGGMKLIQWQLPDNTTVEFQTEVPQDWKSSGLSENSRIIEWNGDPGDAVTEATIIGSFTMHGSNETFEMDFLARDFGGRGGAPNTLTRTLLVNIQPDPEPEESDPGPARERD